MTTLLLVLLAGTGAQTFEFTGAPETFVVPPDVYSLNVVATGAAGGTSLSGVPGQGARVTARIPVTPGSTLIVRVGGVGGSRTGPPQVRVEGGYNGGGDATGSSGGRCGGGGGGATDLRTSLDELGSRILVAGGGGGAGTSGTSPYATGGGGGIPVGGEGTTGSGGGGTGQGGTLSAGGAAGTGGSGGNPTPGTLGEGGIGDGHGGGGGGGYYGGGGGENNNPNAGGGGGGSSYVLPGATQVSYANTAAPASVTLSWTLPDLMAASVQVVEGQTGTTDAVVTFVLSEPAGVAGVWFDVATLDGTATEENDYVAVTLSDVFIPAGGTEATVVVPVRADDLFEPQETFSLQVTNVRGAFLAGAPPVVTITDDDGGEPRLILPEALTLAEDTTLFVAINAFDPDTPDSALEITASATGVVTAAVEGRTLSVTPAPNAHGEAEITVTCSDGTTTKSATLALTVTPVDDPPVLAPLEDRVADEGAAVEVPLAFSDIDTAELVVSASDGTVNGGILTLQASVSKRVTVTVSDGQATAAQSFFLSVNPKPEPEPEPSGCSATAAGPGLAWILVLAGWRRRGARRRRR